MKKPLLSVIILSYNTQELLRNCLQSVIASQGFKSEELEIVIVDNASNDGSAGMVNEEFPQVKLIQNSKNVGFSAGNNIGIRQSKGKYILFLNSDTKVEPNALYSMIRIIEQDQTIGAATCKLILGNRKIDPACHRGMPTPWNAFAYMLSLEKIFPSSHLFGGYHQGWKNLSKLHEIDVISGAFFMIPVAVINKIGLLDESFFMYGEDIDWCYRIKQASYKIVFNPQVITVHYKKQSGRAHKYDKNLRKNVHYSFMDTMAQFYMKHYVNKYPLPLTWLVKLGIKIKKFI